ncbi:purine/pyrimidine permease [Brevibacillus sp. B_LB10_24]|uniref:purine/pyrimidine permease n=1 Tax=Brevibacillus sp. B_LB10_24 TaxID=3380645 RepID=UPI0038B71690
MKYSLYDRPPMGVTFLSSLQWLIVTLSTTVAIPIVVGNVFGLNPEEIGRFMQQTIFFVGLASLLQAVIGHGYPMIEGPAGMWWSIFLILAQIGAGMGLSPSHIGQSIELGLIVAGVLFIILGALRWIGKIQQWFTPTITGTYMILLAVSLCTTFVKGMLGIDFQQSQVVQPKIAIASIVIMALVVLFMRIPKITSYAVLLGMVIGWIGYALLGWAEPVRPTSELVVWPKLFFWGPPQWDAGILLTSVLTGFVLLTNLITSVVVLGRVTGKEAGLREFNRGGVFTGVSHLLSGTSGVVGMIPLSLSAAVIETTKMAARLPFIVAMIAMMAIGILPGVSHFLASIPTPVAYAAMFVTYTQLLGFGLKDFTRVQMNERSIIVIGSSLLIGIGVMFVPTEAWKTVHPLLSFLLGNGLLLGVLTALLLEHVVFRQPKAKEKNGPAQ